MVLLGAVGLVHCSQAAEDDDGASGDDGAGATVGSSAGRNRRLKRQRVLDNSDERNPFHDIYCDGIGTE